MRYILQKDTPLYKAGDEFYINSRGTLVHKASGTGVYTDGVLKKYPNLLRDWFKEAPKTVDDLKYGDKCYIICSSHGLFGATRPYIAERVFDPDLEAWREIGEVFVTQEEAEKQIAWQKAEAILKRDTKGYKVKRNNGSFYIVKCDVYAGDLDIDVYDSGMAYAMAACPLAFATREDAEASVAAHEKEWKTYLGVEE